MKKTIILVAVLASALLSSCKKETEQALPQPVTENVSVTKTGSLSPGAIHNNLLSGYIDLYGLAEDEEITLAEARADYLAICQIAQNRGLGSTRLTPAQEAGFLTAYAAGAGFFNNGVLSAPQVLVTAAIQRVENTAVRAAFTQVYVLAQQGDDSWEEASQQVLIQLTGLSLKDKNIVDGFGSVLGSSYELWRGKTSVEAYRKKFVAVCDAIGYAVGQAAEDEYHENMRYEADHDGYNYYAENMHWAEKTSAAWSAQAAKTK